jgi:hypothetical protein
MDHDLAMKSHGIDGHLVKALDISEDLILGAKVIGRLD